MTGQHNPAKTGGFRITLRRGQETHVRAKLYCDIGIAPVTVELTRDLDPDDPFRKQPDIFIRDALNESASAMMRTNAGTVLAILTGDRAGSKDKDIQVIGYTVAIAGMPIGTLEANVYLEATVKTAEGLDMTGVIIETHSPPMGEPFPVEKRITTNYHQSFVPPKTPFTMFPPSRRMRAAPPAPVPEPKPARDTAPEESMNPLNSLRSELETEGLLDPPRPQTPITPEGGELMQSETKKPAPSLKVKVEIDDLDLKTPGNRAIVVTVVEGDIPRGMVVSVNALISQGRKAPERRTASFVLEEGKWVVRFAITDKGGRANIFSPDKIFDDPGEDIVIPDMSGEGNPVEKTDVHMRLPELHLDITDVSGPAEDQVFAGGGVRPLPDVPTQESPPENHKLPRPAGVKRLTIGNPVEDAMPAPTAPPPASAEDAEWEGPKTKEIPSPAINAALADSIATIEQAVHVPADVMAALDTTPPRGVDETTQPSRPASLPPSGPEKRDIQEIFADVKKKHEQRTATPVPTKLSARESNGLEVPVRPSELVETSPAPKAPEPAPVTAPPPRAAPRMGPAPPPPPAAASPLATLFDEVPPPPATPAASAPASRPTQPPMPVPHTGPVEAPEPQAAPAVEDNQPAAAPAPEDTMTAREPPLPEHNDTGPTQPMAPVPSLEKMSLAARARRKGPESVPKEEQQTPSPPPGIQEVPMTSNTGAGGNSPPTQQSPSLGNFAMKTLIVLGLATATVVVGFYAVSHMESKDDGKKEKAPKEKVEDKPEKGHADDEAVRFGDERDDQGFDHLLPDDDVANCRVAIGDGDKTMPLEQWFSENAKDPSFETKYPIATKNGRPIVQIKPKGEKVGPFYSARWTADWHVDCSHVSDK